MRTFLAFICTCSLLIMGGLGCKGLSTEEQISIRPVSINYWTTFNDVPALEAFAETYQQLRPYVTINIRQVRADEFDTLFTNALADDVGPDIVSVNVRALSRYQSRLAPMPGSVKVAKITMKGTYAKETVVTQDTNVMPSQNGIKSNFVKTVGEDAIIGGQVYGLPLAMDTLAIYYNKDLLDKSGVPLPPTTWTEFVETVKKTTKIDGNGNIIQSGVALGTDTVDNMADILSVLVMQNGVQMTNGRTVAFANGLEKKNVESHPTMEALRFYTDFARPTKEVYSWNEKMGNALDEFARGKTVFYFGFAYDLPRIRAKAPQMNVDVIPLPQLNEESPSNVASYWVESVVKKSKHQNEAWDFIRFITAPENIKKYTEQVRRPSPLRSQITAQAENPLLAPFATQVLQAKNWYRGRDVDTANSALRTMIREYLQPYGEKVNPAERDANIILKAASVVQQTM